MSPAASPAQVSRTAAGDHEIAVPSLGLSLTQRRLLTLLDSPIAAQSLAERSGLPPEKFIRDLGRLASFRLVEGALPQDVLRGAAPGDTVTRAAVAMPAAVTIRPAANAESIADRGERRTSGRRWLVPAAVVAIVALAAFGYWWLRGARESSTAEPSAPLQAPAASAAQDAARPAAQPASAPSAASIEAAPPPLSIGASAAAPGAAAESRQPVRRTAAERAAVTAAIAALRRSETQSIATNADAQPRAAATAAKTQSATRAETAPRTAPPATAAPVAVDRTGQTGQTAAQRTDEAPAASPTAAHSAVPAAPSVVPSAAPTIPHRSEEPSAAAPTLAAPTHSAPTPSAPSQPTPAHLAPPADAAPRIPIEAPAVLAPIARVAPEFPAEAIRRRIDSGRVRAQVTVDAGGHVTGVAIVSASPRGVFDDAVTTALGKWRFPAGAAGRKADVDVEFHRD
jgi:protein TonB